MWKTQLTCETKTDNNVRTREKW